MKIKNAKKLMLFTLSAILCISCIPMQNSAVAVEGNTEILAEQLSMPIVSIDTLGNSVSTKEYYVDAQVTLYDENGAVNIDTSDISIRLRGNMTLDAPKKSYRFKFPEKQNPLTIGDGAAKSWNLVANYHDALISVNSGSLITPLTDETAEMYSEIIKGETSGIVTLNESMKYRYKVTGSDSFNVIAFVSDESGTSRKLLAISVISGIIIMLILLIIIFIVSGNVIKPVAETFDKQKQFISNASHELKTPVTVISATADMLERKIGKDKWIDQIKAQSERMGNLVNELLELSRLSETEKCRLNFEKINLSETVNNTILFFESRAYEENHPIEFDIAENIHIHGDALKLERLVGILLDNALKYADNGGVITVSLRQEKDRSILTCTNPCKDFNVSDISRLFERFYRCEESHSSERDGYGLGLSIAKAITDLHGGKTEVTYSDGSISFIVLLK